jgi:hypothetical protein
MRLVVIAMFGLLAACGGSTGSSETADLPLADGPADTNQTSNDLSADLFDSVSQEAIAEVATELGEDTSPRTPGASHIGQSCASDLDCAGGVCLEWLQGGYCTVTGCSFADPCPGGSICAPLHQDEIEFTACLQRCDMLDDCRTEHQYTCDRDMTCWPSPGEGVGLYPEGGPCRMDTECGADFGAVCYPEYYADQPTGFTDGYCIIWECKSAGCPVGTRCVDVNNSSSACFKECDTEDDCRPGYLCHAAQKICVAGCETALECPQKHICLNGHCLESSYACSVSNPAGWCPENEWCDDGECAEAPVGCAEDDLYEPNGVKDKASLISGESLWGLRLCGEDHDWYRVVAPAGQLTEIKMVFNNHAGNLDMLVYDEGGQLIRSRWINYPYKELLIADFDVSSEAVTFYPPENERVLFLQVVGSSGNDENSYGFVIRHYPFADGEDCQALYPLWECQGLPGGTLKLYQFPEPEGGDPYGDDLYHFETVSGYKWARRELLMLVRHTLYETKAEYPDMTSVGIIDACQEDGITPGDNIGQPRHCRTCHDEGGNIDLAYFALDGINWAKTVCGPDGANVTADGMQCTQAAATQHIVDLEKQVFFMSLLFDSGRVRAIGIDPVIALPIQQKAKAMYEAGQISAAGYNGMMTQFGLWPTHHNHIHLSLHWWPHQ